MRLVANTGYWDKERGPYLREIVLRNDLSSEKALDLVCTTEGEVDILTGVSPADAGRVESSEHAKLIAGTFFRSSIRHTVCMRCLRAGTLESGCTTRTHD